MAKAKTFKEVLGNKEIKLIAKDARDLLCAMQDSTCWKETLKSGLANYATTHSKLEYLAFKAALSLNICWAIGEYFFEVILTPLDTLVKQIGDSDSTVENYQFKIFTSELI